ncbi:MAG: hypothetical protein PHD76_11435 [Methylacidiphilales bacterium]|nr:hypothetical protein [Candidatus Methylacidiphilales bacterium]
MRIKILAVAFWGVFLSAAIAGSSKPGFVLRFYLQSTTQTGSNWTLVEVPDPPQTIAIEKYGFLSEKYIDKATLLPDGTTLIQFDSIGVNVLNTTTSANIGKIMVVVCNNRVIYAPVIDQPLTQGRIMLPGIQPEELKQLREYIEKHKKG